MSPGLIYANAVFFLRAGGISLLIFFFSALFSIVISLAFGSLASSQNRALRAPARVVIEFFRDVPQIVSVFFVFFGAPAFGLQLGPVEATIISLSLWGGANGAEIVRGGINSIPTRQFEACRALGLRGIDAFIFIILPQAIKPVIPAYGGLCTVLLQSTALGALIGATELLKSAQIVIERAAFAHGGMPGITVYGFILVVYFTISSGLMRGTRLIERAFRPGRQRRQP
ncbi:amino acid ABC transporter permease [Paraburkholderia caledonica]|uniref:Polar amino acid transport system permease protein n=1 Tax=Paraburkholderia caledonica TaxID=134536 RepID=A0AB73IMK2_9BURK|nr:polar amino acid transport system permease protein [Paraburkholderia caledonica]